MSETNLQFILIVLIFMFGFTLVWAIIVHIVECCQTNRWMLLLIGLAIPFVAVIHGLAVMSGGSTRSRQRADVSGLTTPDDFLGRAQEIHTDEFLRKAQKVLKAQKAQDGRTPGAGTGAV